MTNKLQRIGISLAAALVVLGGGYALGNHRVFNTQPAVATTEQASSTDEAKVSGVDSAMVVSAVGYYYGEKNISPEMQKIINLEIDGDAARGKVKNADSGSVFYAQKVNGEWTVVYAGQATLTQQVADQYKLPSDWVGKTSW